MDLENLMDQAEGMARDLLRKYGTCWPFILADDSAGDIFSTPWNPPPDAAQAAELREKFRNIGVTAYVVVGEATAQDDEQDASEPARIMILEGHAKDRHQTRGFRIEDRPQLIRDPGLDGSGCHGGLPFSGLLEALIREIPHGMAAIRGMSPCMPV
jgi:hypothetical protein